MKWKKGFKMTKVDDALLDSLDVNDQPVTPTKKKCHVIYQHNRTRERIEGKKVGFRKKKMKIFSHF